MEDFERVFEVKARQTKNEECLDMPTPLATEDIHELAMNVKKLHAHVKRGGILLGYVCFIVTANLLRSISGRVQSS